MDDLEIIKFSATWCGPCKRYAPIFDEFVEETDIKASSVDIDEHPEEAEAYDVKSVPTTVFLRNGEVVGSVQGAQSKPSLRKLVASFDFSTK